MTTPPCHNSPATPPLLKPIFSSFEKHDTKTTPYSICKGIIKILAEGMGDVIGHVLTGIGVYPLPVF